jgi:hypothetical protein
MRRDGAGFRRWRGKTIASVRVRDEAYLRVESVELEMRV